jgi:hypothetical protein
VCKCNLGLVTRQHRAANGVTPLAWITGCFVRAAPKHVSCIAQKRIAQAIALHAKGIEQPIGADDHRDSLIWRQVNGRSWLCKRGLDRRSLVTMSDKVRERHPLDDESIRSAGVSGSNIDADV